MAITNGYCTLSEARARLGITDVSDTTDDINIEMIVEAVSRLIDEYCGRHFYKDSADATRYFTAEFTDYLDAGDLVSVTTIKADEDGDRTYERTWAATDYDLTPYDADDWGKPYTAVETAPNGNYAFPLIAKGVQIVGKWGWPAVPKTITEACLLQVERLFKRKDAIFGVIGSGEMGQLMVIPTIDPDVVVLLRPYIKLRIGGV